MSATMNRLAIPVPQKLQYRPRDERGYPIPYIVLKDAKGKYHFTINDMAKVADVVKRQACGICGRPLAPNASFTGRRCFFVGSPVCFLNRAGAFLDPAMHEDCATYALRVCPYLAVRGYGGPGGAKMTTDGAPERVAVEQGYVAAFMERTTLSKAQPEIFMLGEVSGFSLGGNSEGYVIKPHHPWVSLAAWCGGRELKDSEWEPYERDDGLVSLRLIQQTDKESTDA